MSMCSAQRPWAILLSLLLLLRTATPVWAGDPVTLQLQAPTQVDLGEKVPVIALLKDSKGNPVPGATIILWRPASFLSKAGTIELGRATTDAQGKVSFVYEARSEGPVQLNAYFAGNSRYDPAQSAVELTVAGAAQLYQETAGVRVPGLGVWLLVAVLGGVWATYFAVMVLLTLIAREGARAAVGAGERHG